jgi:hypothetical protein
VNIGTGSKILVKCLLGIGLFASTAYAQTTNLTPVTPVAAAPSVLSEKMQAAKKLNTDGNPAQAAVLWKEIYTSADKTPEQQKLAMDAAKYLGFYAVESRDVRSAEAYFAAESIIARRLFITGQLSARTFSSSVSHWATGAGAMGRSSESAALVFFAREIKARAQAMESQKILNREASFSADSVEGIRVSANSICVINNVEILSKQISCADEASAIGEAMSLQARQIKADAPPPEKKDDKKKGEEE